MKTTKQKIEQYHKYLKERYEKNCEWETWVLLIEFERLFGLPESKMAGTR